MDASLSDPFGASRDLPPYLGILAVDAKDFTGQPSVAHQELSGLIVRLAGEVFAAVGLSEVWNDPPFFGSTGDGFAIGVPTASIPYLIHPFLAELQDTLARHNRAARHGQPRIRLRVSVNVGPVSTATADSVVGGGNGTPRNDTHRLLDSDQVKAMLADASANTTFVAAILSDRVYQDVVVGGYSGRHPDHFTETQATVPGKTFGQRAWLHTPEPSGNLFVGRAPERAAGSRGSRQRARDHASVRVTNNRGQVAGHVTGGMHMEQTRDD